MSHPGNWSPSGSGVERIGSTQSVDAGHFHFQNEYWATVGGEPDAHAPYNPGDLLKLGKAIRHLPMVVKHCVEKAQECIQGMDEGENFEIVLSNNPDIERPKAYIAPANSQGIQAEIEDAVLLKAAINMQGR